MAFCKYLEDLGITRKDYDCDLLTDENDSRNERFKKEKEEYGFDSRETWDLDYTIAVFLYSRLKMYKEKASNIIDLKFHIIEFEEKTYNQEEAIDFIIEKIGRYIKHTSIKIEEDEEIYNDYIRAIRMLAEIMSHLWW